MQKMFRAPLKSWVQCVATVVAAEHFGTAKAIANATTAAAGLARVLFRHEVQPLAVFFALVLVESEPFTRRQANRWIVAIRRGEDDRIRRRRFPPKAHDHVVRILVFGSLAPVTL